MIWKAFTANLKRPDWHPAPTRICTSHIHQAPLAATPLPPSPTILPALKVCVEDVNRVFRKQNARKASGPDGISPACLKVCADQLPPYLHRSSTDLWSCAKFPAASNTPPSFLSPKIPKSLALTTTDLSFSRLWSWSHLRDWSWPTWRTSLDLCWILFTMPTEQTGLWMMLSIWDCIKSSNTSTNLGITQGSYLWTSARPSIPSCLTFSQTNWHGSLCPPPSVSGSPASWQTGSS